MTHPAKPPTGAVDYDTLRQDLRAKGVTLDPAEVHGTVCGVASASRDPGAVAWTALLPKEGGESPEEMQAFVGQLVTLHRHILSQLQGEGFEFDLLLPDERLPLTVRVAGLGQWVRGYLMGLVAGGVREFRALSGDAPEILEDLVRIAEVEPDDTEADQEQDFTELHEYVRIGVQAVFEELSSRPSGVTH